MGPYELKKVGSHQHTDLNFAVTGANSQVASLFGPGQRADVVLLALQLHEKSDVSLSGIPQVNTVMECHSENISTAPVKQIQIWKKQKGTKQTLAVIKYLYKFFICSIKTTVLNILFNIYL